jgi:O-methyltransferase involved in polyketide biosynthesis
MALFRKRFLTPSLRVLVELSRFPALNSRLIGIIDRRWPGARTSGVARTRAIDDLTPEALSQGMKQIVLLGAGFDSRPYRLTGMENAMIYKDDLDLQLRNAGSRSSLGTFVIWEGVSNYLSEEAVP